MFLGGVLNCFCTDLLKFCCLDLIISAKRQDLFFFLYKVSTWVACFLIELVHNFDCSLKKFFKKNTKTSCPPSWKFFSPMTNSSMEISPRISPSPRILPPTKKIPLKASVHFPITITICKHWSKFETCSPSHGDSGGARRTQKHIY